MTQQSDHVGREYASLREEILQWLKVRATLGITVATVTAGLFIFAGQRFETLPGQIALLLPQFFVAWAYAFLRRNARLTSRMACYLAVFHDASSGGGWELFQRYPFEYNHMRGSYIKTRWIHPGLYTTQGLLLVVLMTSACLIMVGPATGALKAAGIILPVVIVGHHIWASRARKSYEGKCLVQWRELKDKSETVDCRTILDTIIGDFTAAEGDSKQTPAQSDLTEAATDRSGDSIS